MPRIRKKTSNRGTTNQRKRITQKVRESRKKAKKAAQKNPQWKSKTPKDPGIPNNFPFKDQILAEVSEQRRIDAEEKLRKKEERKALRAKARAENDSEEGEEEEKGGEATNTTVELELLKGSQVGNDAIGGVGAKQLTNSKIFSRPAPAPAHEEEDDDDDVPVLVNRDLPNLKAVLDDADVVVQVLDARDPLSFRSSHLEKLVASKKGRVSLLVLNKIDTCPRESITSWAAHLRSEHPTVLFRSATAFLPAGSEASTKGKGKGRAKAPSDDGLGVDSVLAYLGEWAKAKKGKKPLAVAVVGVTNVGKSSFINSLARRKAFPVYTVETSSRGPTTTELPQELVVEAGGQQIRLIDTPGLSWQADEEEENLESVRARDILSRSKGRIDRLKDPTFVVANIVARASTEDLMLLYSLPAFEKGNPTSFLSGIARSNQLVKKRGELDLIGASRILLRDWSTGKFARYTSPPQAPAVTASPTKNTALKLYAADEAILETVVPRKELRAKVGLVKFIPGEIDSRHVVLDEPWLEAEDSEEENEEEPGMEVDQDDDEDEGEEEEEEDDEAEEEEEEEEEEVAPPSSKKQKRKRTNEPTAAPPSKKVAFSADLKSSKQARKAGSLKEKATKPKPSPTASKPKATPAIAKPERKAANLASKGKANTKVAVTGAGGEEAYDFGKFF